MNNFVRHIFFGGKGGVIPPTPVRPVLDLKVSKTVSRYTVGSTVSTSDIVCKAMYEGGTEEVVTPTIDTTNTSTATKGVTYVDVSYAGYTLKLPLTVYDPQDVDDNLLTLADTPLTEANGFKYYIKDNIVHVEGKTLLGGKAYLKLTGTPNLLCSVGNEQVTIPNSWKSESVASLTSGNTYSMAIFPMSGTATGTRPNVSSARDSSATTQLNATTTNNRKITANIAYVQQYWEADSEFDNYAYGLKIVSGATTPTEWTNVPSGEDTGIELTLGNVAPNSIVKQCALQLKNIKTLCDCQVMQGVCLVGDYLYCGVSNTTGASVTDYVVAKVDTSQSTWTLVGKSSAETPIGHCNGIAYCPDDGYLHCVTLDNVGTIKRVDPDTLAVVDSYVIDLSDKVQNYSGIGNVAYDVTKEKFVFLIYGNDKKYAIYNKSLQFEKLIDLENYGGTYGGVLTDDKYIYQCYWLGNGITNASKIAVYDWDGTLVKKFEFTNFNNELETITWRNGYIMFNSSAAVTYTTNIAKQVIPSE